MGSSCWKKAVMEILFLMLHYLLKKGEGRYHDEEEAGKFFIEFVSRSIT